MSEQKLPMAEAPDRPDPASSEAAPIEVQASSARLISTLAVAGALAGLVIVLVFQWAQPRIEAYQAMVLREAVTEVLGGPERYETVFIEDGRLTAQPQSDTAALDRVYVGFDASDRPVGVAMVGAEPGFQDVIRLIFGFDPATGDVLGMKVLESKETPGLGDKIEKDSTFIGEFLGVGTPLVGVKKGRESGVHAEVVMITGATISSKAIIQIINNRLEGVRDPVTTYWSSPAMVAAAARTEPSAGPAGGGDR